ncbi:MAG TPA: hypothetical protein VG936_17120 [Lacunisphaera sp.]|nr:hypothetical protein [Lacunisphaera sp.]
MNKLLLTVVALALPLAAIAQDAAKAAPAKNIANVYTIEPKPGEESQLEAAIAAHAKKYHKGDFAWHVATILSGPGEGGYLVVEGATSWTAFDDRGDLGAEHTKDYVTTILPHVAKSSPASYYRHLQQLSVKGGDTSSKSVAMHFKVKPGCGGDLYDALKQWKEIYAKLGMVVDVWQTAFSGGNEYVVVFGLKHGLKDFDEESPNFRKAANELYGPRAYERLMQVEADTCSGIWQELLEFKKDLGSP